MSEWLAWATYDPAPETNAGYWNGTSWTISPQVTPDKKYGVVWHSVYGYFTYVNPSAVMRLRGNSWDATIFRDGRVWKHRPTPTWVNWHATGPAQNMMLVGVEMEGKDEPWTEAQWASWRRVVAETWAWFGWTYWWKGRATNRTQDDIRNAILAAARGSNWSHIWVAATACPNGRNDYQRMGLEAALGLEDDMFDESDKQRLQRVEQMLVQLLGKHSPAPAPTPAPAPAPTPAPAPPPPAPAPAPTTTELPYQTWKRLVGRPWPSLTELARIYQTLGITDKVGSAAGNIKVQQRLLQGWRP